MAYHMRIKEAANYLGCSPSTVARRIEQGLLDGKQHGISLCSPTVIPTEQVIALVKLRRDMVVVDAIQGSRPNAVWEFQVRELISRAQKLEEVVGRAAIVELLQRFGVTKFYQLQPDQLRSMQGALFRLTIGFRPYVRQKPGRDGGGVQGMSVREEGEERRRIKRAEGRAHPGQRGRPRKPPGTPEQEIERERNRKSAGGWAQRAREALARERDRELKQAAWPRRSLAEPLE